MTRDDDERRPAEATRVEDSLGSQISDMLIASSWLDGPITEAELPEARRKLATLLTETRAFERRALDNRRPSNPCPTCGVKR